MATTWTNVSAVTTTWTTSSSVTTSWNKLVPVPGFGQGYFGDPTSDDYKNMKIHFRGFGDPQTKWV